MRNGNDKASEINNVSCAKRIELINGYKSSIPVNVKNETDEAVTLNVQMWDSDEWISLKFYPGWNPEVIRAIRPNSDVETIVVGY